MQRCREPIGDNTVQFGGGNDAPGDFILNCENVGAIWAPSLPSWSGSEPNVRNTTPIARQIGEAQIDGNPGLAVLNRRQTAPADQIATNAAEIEGNGPRTPNIGTEPIVGSFNADVVPLVAISPERPIAATDRTIANSGIGDSTLKSPMHRAAMAVPNRHHLPAVTFFD